MENEKLKKSGSLIDKTKDKLKANKRLVDTVDLAAIESVETQLKFEIETHIFETEQLNAVILKQIEDKIKKEPGEIESESNETPKKPHEITEPTESVKIGESLNKSIKISDFDKLSTSHPFKCKDAPIPETDDGNEESYQNRIKHQKEGVKWFHKLHCKNVGGILSDEMGLGKTAQIVSYLAALFFSSKFIGGGFGPVLIVVPSTMIKTWIREILLWWPYFKVLVLHHTGVATHNLLKKFKPGTIIISTYTTVLKYKKIILPITWSYVVLDEGHKIKNPSTAINLMTVKLETPHKIILSGTPIQNNLKELWSLMNFVYPGLLGDLHVFLKDVSSHITKGSYNNATYLQMKTGFTCAKMLKNIISPYLLRRTKLSASKDANLPEKKDFVIFCKLSEIQVKLYNKVIDNYNLNFKDFDHGKAFENILTLRKICNHPSFGDPSLNSHWHHSSKMMALHSLLHEWKADHKVLVYSQSKKMLTMIENYCKNQEFSYLRMDGTLAIEKRQTYVDNFNNDKSIFLFLLTTKVGGVGINLTGADRVVLYDPDWNPSTDLQAKERVWRIGQTKNVQVYRILTSETIEEKMYNRQVFKQFLANKVLQNPGQIRLKLNFGDIHQLFSYVSHKESDSIDVKVDKSLSDIKAKKRKYKWRKLEDISSDDEITPALLKVTKYVEKINEINESGTAFTDRLLLDSEAERIANKAIATMNESGRQIQNKLNIQFGKSDGPGMQILESLSNFSSSFESSDSNQNDFVKSEKFSQDLRDFIVSKNGSATTRDIISHFKDFINKGMETLVFKKVLNKIAIITKNPSDPNLKGCWTIKKEFNENHS